MLAVYGDILSISLPPLETLEAEPNAAVGAIFQRDTRRGISGEKEEKEGEEETDTTRSTGQKQYIGEGRILEWEILRSERD